MLKRVVSEAEFGFADGLPGVPMLSSWPQISENNYQTRNRRCLGFMYRIRDRAYQKRAGSESQKSQLIVSFCSESQKGWGGDSLRRSGLGYTIICRGLLMEEPGGQKALIFYQGNRISQVAHLPDKANNYSTPALSVLEKNTENPLRRFLNIQP